MEEKNPTVVRISDDVEDRRTSTISEAHLVKVNNVIIY